MSKGIYPVYFVLLWENKKINYATIAVLKCCVVIKKNWAGQWVLSWKDDHNRISKQKVNSKVVKFKFHKYIMYVSDCI